MRAGATVTHVHCKDMAAMWMTHLIAATEGAKLHECCGSTGDADSTQTAKRCECSGTTCDAHSTHTAKLYEGLVNACDADLRGGPQHGGQSGAPIPEAAHSLTHTAKLYEGSVDTCDADLRGGPQHAGKSGAPIPEAAHSLGPGQVPKLPPATSRTAGALQAAFREPGICR